MLTANVRDFFDAQAEARPRFVRRNRTYYRDLVRFLRFVVPTHASVIELGCGIGSVIKELPNERKTGIDFAPAMVHRARGDDPTTHYLVDDIEHLEHCESYDYVLLLDTINSLHDVQKALSDIRIKLCHDRTRLIVTYYNYLWEPILRLGELIGIKTPIPRQSWLSRSHVRTLLSLARFEIVTEGERLLFPRYIPLFSWLCNAILAKLPLIRRLCLMQYAVVRPMPYARRELSVSIVIACRNEAGNIERALTSIPRFGKAQELIFVEGGSSDNTWEKLHELQKKYRDAWDIQVVKQEGKGLAAAYHTAIPRAKHDIVMVLNGDLTVDPSELPKFYEVMALGIGDFVNGTRLVYPMEKDAMQRANFIANYGFGVIFSWLLSQRVSDTLCGTKVFFAHDYHHFLAARTYFGAVDPFGDFEMLFGAAKQNCKIVEVPVRYRARTYGSTNILRWRAGVVLLSMCWIAAKRMKFW